MPSADIYLGLRVGPRNKGAASALVGDKMHVCNISHSSYHCIVLSPHRDSETVVTVTDGEAEAQRG